VASPVHTEFCSSVAELWRATNKKTAILSEGLKFLQRWQLITSIIWDMVSYKLEHIFSNVRMYFLHESLRKNSEDGSSRFLENISRYVPEYMVSLARYSLSIFIPVVSTLGHRASVKRFVLLQFFNLKRIGRTPWTGISPTQGRYLHKRRINADKHPCVRWDSNPRSQRSSGRRHFMP
jgi:hypothetical protein